jgi:hypothetical protein
LRKTALNAEAYKTTAILGFLRARTQSRKHCSINDLDNANAGSSGDPGF